MKTPWIIPRNSAMDVNQVRQCISNDVVRRLEKISIELLDVEVKPTLDTFNRKMIFSGYSLEDRLTTLEDGLTKFYHKLEARRSQQFRYRSSVETLINRERKDAIGKTTWYKGWGRKPGDNPDSTRHHLGRRGTKRKTEDQPRMDTRAVIFVEHTPGSTLAKKLRDEENKMAEVTGYKIRIVEKGGDRLDRMLIQADLEEGADCQRDDCRLCESKVITGKTKQSCTRRNLTYRAECLFCKESEVLRPAEYIGETGTDLYTRAKRHYQLWVRGDTSSWMLRHHFETHKEVPREDVHFSFEAIKYHRTAFERQVEEACLIKWSRGDPGINNCNLKLEYNRSIVPELGDMGATPEDIKKSETITKEILAWREARKSRPPENITIKRKNVPRMVPTKQKRKVANTD